MLPAYQKALRRLYTPEVNRLLLDLREYRRRINRFLVANETLPALRTLRDRALLDASLSNGRLDGSSVSDRRLYELSEQEADPTNSQEAQIMGYRFTLSTIEDSYPYIRISTGAISQLHRDLYRYAEDACGGRWTDAGESDVFVGELDRMAARRDGGRFVTKQALLRDACNNYRQAIATHQFDPIVESCMFMLDVLNIAPFVEGNGRLARMLFQLLCYQNGFMAFRYEPLAEQIEALGPKFFETVAACPRTAAENGSEYDAETDYEPFVLMMLQALLDSCMAFGERFDLDAIDATIVEEPEDKDESPEETAASLRRSSLADVSREERMAMREAMQATAREILQQPVSPAFTGTIAESRARAYRAAAPAPVANDPAAAAARTAPDANATATTATTVATAGASASVDADPALAANEETAASASSALAAAGSTAAPTAEATGSTAAPTAEATGSASGPAAGSDSVDEATASDSAAAEHASAPATSAKARSAGKSASAGKAAAAPSNEAVVRAYFKKLKGSAAKKDVVAACPGMSAKTVERMIQKLLAEGTIEKVGAARATTYRKR